MATYTQPIWKDADVVLAVDETAIEYRIQVKKGNTWETIFQGKAFARPGMTNPTVRINDICSDYLTKELPLLGHADQYDGTFKVEYWMYDDWYEKDTYIFTRDWSYDLGFAPATDIPVDPVVLGLNPDQYLPLFSRDGVFAATIRGGDFNEDFNLDFSAANWYVSQISDGVTYFLDLSQYPGWSTIEANGLVYKAADLCGGFVLYYINAYGGWDSLPVAGRAVKVDGITRHNRDVVYNNGSYTARGRDNFVNEIQERFRLYVGMIGSEAAKRMHHLIGSTFVYLHDLEKGRVYPVVLTATSHEHQTRVGMLANYELEAVIAQDRIRR